MKNIYIILVLGIVLLSLTPIYPLRPKPTHWVEIGVVRLKGDNDPFSDIYWAVFTNEHDIWWSTWLWGTPPYTRSIFAYSNVRDGYSYVSMYRLEFIFTVENEGDYYIQYGGTAWTCAIWNWCRWWDIPFFYYSTYLTPGTYKYTLQIPAYESPNAVVQIFVISRDHVIKTWGTLYIDDMPYSNYYITFSKINDTAIYWQLTVNIDSSLDNTYVNYIRLVIDRSNVVNAVNEISNITHNALHIALIKVDRVVRFGDSFTLGVYYVF